MTLPKSETGDRGDTAVRPARDWLAAWSAVFHQAGLVGGDHELGAVMGTELGQDPADMHLEGRHAQVQVYDARLGAEELDDFMLRSRRLADRWLA
jgi:hypothetical protein